MKARNGFTLVEIAVTLGVLAIILSIGIVLTSTTLGRNQVDNVTADIVSTLRRAQWQSMNGHENEDWGVHFESDAFTLFRGTTYSASDPNNVTTSLPSSISIENISLNGGGSDVLFDEVFGGTGEYGSMDIVHSSSPDSFTVTVNEVGMIDWN